MGTYTLRSINNSNDYMTIVRELDDGYVVRIVRDKDGYSDVTPFDLRFLPHGSHDRARGHPRAENEE